MRFMVAAGVFATWIGCGPSSRNEGGDDTSADACVGLECRVVDCAKQGKPPTTVSGTVFAPNGTLALYGVNVYVPASEPPPFAEGAVCEQCTEGVPGGAITHVVSDEAGHFTLTGVPSVGVNIPLIISIGKWRRRVDIPSVIECTDNPLPATLTSLPKNKAEGDIPKIAIATGSCDALECLVRKLGVSDSEFTSDTGTGRIHLFASNGAAKLADQTPFAPATTLWNSVDKLKQYDIAMLSCECSQRADEKPQSAMDAMKAYADFGGRLFLSHYHNVWIGGEKNVPTHAPAVWPTIATCNTDTSVSGIDIIDQVHNPKGASFATWLVNVLGSTSPGMIPITEGKQTCTAVDDNKAERWVYHSSGSVESPQNFQFTTPNEIAKEERCGKVVFSDMHVASGSSSSSSTAFPGGCSASPMTPQEKALAFMFFDIASCVGPIL